MVPCSSTRAAAGARYAQSIGFRRVLIVDWDVHHGDGTQDIFANDAGVHCISIHGALDLYMAAMNILAERRRSPARVWGTGTSRCSGRSTRTTSGHRDDQGGGVTEWTEADYAAMTCEVLALSRRASCPVLSMHGGGYHLESAVASAVAHVGVLAGAERSSAAISPPSPDLEGRRS
jgi:acetoin utilization deacetylase AcuC-like enzyme